MESDLDYAIYQPLLLTHTAVDMDSRGHRERRPPPLTQDSSGRNTASRELRDVFLRRSQEEEGFSALRRDRRRYDDPRYARRKRPRGSFLALPLTLQETLLDLLLQEPPDSDLRCLADNVLCLDDRRR